MASERAGGGGDLLMVCVCVHSYESVSGIQMGQVSKNPYLPSKEYL